MITMDATEAGRRMALAAIEALQDGTIDRGQYDEMVGKASFTPEYPATGQTLPEWRTERQISISFRHTITRVGPKP